MPVEAKPLFRPDVLQSHLSGFQMPTVDAIKLAHWAGEISSGRLDRFSEQEILPPFFADVFVGLLGYTGPAGHDRYTIGYERHVEVDGKYADAVLGVLATASLTTPQLTPRRSTGKQRSPKSSRKAALTWWSRTRLTSVRNGLGSFEQ